MAEHEVNNLSELSPQQVAALSMVFEECTNALVICQEGLKRISKRSTNTIDVRVLRELERLEVIDERALNDEMKESIRDMQERATCEKLQEDCIYLRGIMEELRKEIVEEGTYDVLTKEIERISGKRKEEEALLAECSVMKRTRTELRRTLAEEKMNNEAKRTRLRNILLDLKNENERARIAGDSKVRYSCAWNKARCEENSIVCENEWEELKEKLEELSTRERMEERVSEELTKFLLEDIARIEGKIEEWQERYDREERMYEREIRKVRNEIEERQGDLKELSREYQEKQEFMDAYLVEKEDLRKRMEHERHVRECAIKIQAWWRGVMVRRKLGPYRPEEKKKKRQFKGKK